MYTHTHTHTHTQHTTHNTQHTTHNTHNTHSAIHTYSHTHIRTHEHAHTHTHTHMCTHTCMHVSHILLVFLHNSLSQYHYIPASGKYSTPNIQSYPVTPVGGIFIGNINTIKDLIHTNMPQNKNKLLTYLNKITH